MSDQQSRSSDLKGGHTPNKSSVFDKKKLIPLTKLSNFRDMIKDKLKCVETNKEITPYEYVVTCFDLNDPKWKNHVPEKLGTFPAKIHVNHADQTVSEKCPEIFADSFKLNRPDSPKVPCELRKQHHSSFTCQYPKTDVRGKFIPAQSTQAESLDHLLSKYNPFDHLLSLLSEYGCECLVEEYMPELSKRHYQGKRFLVFVRMTPEEERRAITRFEVERKGTVVLTSADRVLYIESILKDYDKINITNFEKIAGIDFVESYFPIHDREVNHHLIHAITWNLFISFESLNTIRNHFGEQVAFYFAWIDFYNRMLLLPAMVGLLVFLYSYYDEVTYSKMLPGTGILVLVWGTCFNNLWKRKEQELAIVWQADNRASLKKYRNEYVEKAYKLKTNLITNQSEPYYPSSDRRRSYIKTAIVFVLQVLVLIFLTSSIFLHSVWAYFEYADQPTMQMIQVSVINTVLYVLLIVVLNYTAVVFSGVWLTNAEVHPTQERHETMLAHKIFSFYVTDGFLWYIILAFVQIPLAGTETMYHFLGIFGIDMSVMKLHHPEEFKALTSEEYWMQVLHKTIVGYFTMSQFIPLLIATLIPILSRRIRHMNKKRKNKKLAKKIKEAKEARKSESYIELAEVEGGRRGESQQEDDDDDDFDDIDEDKKAVHKTIEERKKMSEIDQLKYHIFEKDPERAFHKLREQAKRYPIDLFDDYEDMILEYGYVLVFSVLWPLIPMLAFLNNLCEIRADLIRMTEISRRTTFLRTGGIGVYQTHLDVMTVLAVVLTLGLVMVATHNMDVYFEFFRGTGYQSVVFDESGHTKLWIRFLIAVIVEHLIFATQNFLVAVSRAVPAWVEFFHDTIQHNLEKKLISEREAEYEAKKKSQ